MKLTAKQARYNLKSLKKRELRKLKKLKNLKQFNKKLKKSLKLKNQHHSKRLLLLHPPVKLKRKNPQPYRQ